MRFIDCQSGSRGATAAGVDYVSMVYSERDFVEFLKANQLPFKNFSYKMAIGKDLPHPDQTFEDQNS